MEGYVEWYKRGKYQRYWTVLDGQQLSYYEKLDLQLQEAVNVQGVYFIQNATITKLSYQHKDNCISIKCEGKKSIEYINCETSMSQTNWYKALEWGSRLHEEEKNRLEAPLQYRSMLGIPPDAPLTRNYLVKVFRKLSLQCHPDKGGDHEKFTAIRHAYTSLLALHNEEYEKKNSIEIEYEAVIERAQGAGLGIVVLEDPVRRRIVVQTVLKNIILKGLSEESEGEIRPGDCLTTIENDHCQHWPLSRVRERLNSYRVPAGSIVRLTLSRRILQQKSSDSPPTSPTESERGARDQYPLTAPPSLLDPGNDEQPPPPPDDALLTPSPLRNNRSWTSDEESPFSPAERTPKSSPRPKKNVAMSPPQSPELQYPPKMQINFGARSTKISHTSQQTEEVPKSSYVEEKSPFLSRNSDSELNESYETDDSGDSKTIPRTSIGPHERVLLPEENHRFKQLKQTLITSPESMQNNPTIENQLTSQSIEQILNEISFTSLPNLINHDSHREDQNLFKQWEQELSRLEDDDEAEESNHGIFLSKINSNQTLDYEAELLKTKSDLFSSHTIRTQMASHIDLLTNEINELKERSLALTTLVHSKSHEDLEQQQKYSDLLQSISEMTSLRHNQRQLLNSLSISKFLLKGKIRDLSQELKLFTEEKDENQGNTSYLLNEMKGNEEIYQQYKNNFREMEEKIKNLLCTSSEAL